MRHCHESSTLAIAIATLLCLTVAPLTGCVKLTFGPANRTQMQEVMHASRD